MGNKQQRWRKADLEELEAAAAATALLAAAAEQKRAAMRQLVKDDLGGEAKLIAAAVREAVAKFGHDDFVLVFLGGSAGAFSARRERAGEAWTEVKLYNTALRDKLASGEYGSVMTEASRLLLSEDNVWLQVSLLCALHPEYMRGGERMAWRVTRIDK